MDLKGLIRPYWPLIMAIKAQCGPKKGPLGPITPRSIGLTAHNKWAKAYVLTQRPVASVGYNEVTSRPSGPTMPRVLRHRALGLYVSKS